MLILSLWPGWGVLPPTGLGKGPAQGKEAKPPLELQLLSPRSFSEKSGTISWPLSPSSKLPFLLALHTFPRFTHLPTPARSTLPWWARRINELQCQAVGDQRAVRHSPGLEASKRTRPVHSLTQVALSIGPWAQYSERQVNDTRLCPRKYTWEGRQALQTPTEIPTNVCCNKAMLPRAGETPQSN